MCVCLMGGGRYTGLFGCRVCLRGPEIVLVLPGLISNTHVTFSLGFVFGLLWFLLVLPAVSVFVSWLRHLSL